MTDTSYPMHVGIVVQSSAQLAAVYALLGGASLAVMAAPGVAAAADRPRPTQAGDAKPATVLASAGNETAAQESLASAGTGPAATSVASPSDDAHDPSEVDAGGHPWSADLHASTRSKTKDGFWRMKVGVARPDPLPGFSPSEAQAAPAAAAAGNTGTSVNGAASLQPASASAAPAGPATVEDEDEFAAFRAAAEKSNATDNAAAAAVPARKWSDSDLGALCNQAAVKLGDPSPIKEIIATFTPEGQVPHSRNIPDDRREAFAQAVEAKAGITFAG